MACRGIGPRRVNVREPGSREGVTCVGRMEMGPEILGYGSGGTLVFEGQLDGRPVAVKRILHQVVNPSPGEGICLWHVCHCLAQSACIRQALRIPYKFGSLQTSP